VCGLSATAGQLAGATNTWGGDPFQHRIFGHGHHIFQFRLSIQEVQHRGMRKSTIQAHPNDHTRKIRPNHLHQTSQQPHRAHRRRGVARTEHRRAQVLLDFLVETDKAQHRQIAPVVVMPVKK
jgi:hypothetical protein